MSGRKQTKHKAEPFTSQVTNPAHEMVVCVICKRGATFTEDAVCRACRPNIKQDKPSEVNR